jgi:hypothetical protein
MEDHTLLPEYSKEDLDRAFEEALAAAERLHKRLASAAEDAGYVINVINFAKPTFDGLYLRAQDDPSAYPIIASGVDFLKGLGSELNRLAGIADDFATPFGPIVNSTGTFSATSDTASILWDPDYKAQPIPLPPNRKSREYYSAKLKGLDPSLANSYDQVWQTYLVTSSDPHRASLFMMRTLFDNFFAKLAPDDEVRSSRYWHRKEGEKPNQIWRSERIAYALEKNIKDGNRRAILEAEAKQISALYDAANIAHDRGALDEDKASRALMAMDSFLKDWLDSLE